VQLRPGVALTAQDILSAIKPYLAGYKLPRRIEFRD